MCCVLASSHPAAHRVCRLQVQDIAKAQAIALPSLLPFRDTANQASTFRVAALTSLDFLRACALQLAPRPPVTPAGGVTSPCTSATNAHPPAAAAAADSAPGIAVPGVTAAALSVLVRLMEGTPPAEITIDVACELAAAAHACGAEELLSVLPDYLAPLLRTATDKEVCTPAPPGPSSPPATFPTVLPS